MMIIPIITLKKSVYREKFWPETSRMHVYVPMHHRVVYSLVQLCTTAVLKLPQHRHYPTIKLRAAEKLCKASANFYIGSP